MDPFSSANVVLRGLEVNVQEFEINKRKPTDLMQGKVPAQFYFSQLLLPSSVGDLWVSHELDDYFYFQYVVACLGPVVLYSS